MLKSRLKNDEKSTKKIVIRHTVLRERHGGVGVLIHPLTSPTFSVSFKKNNH